MAVRHVWVCPEWTRDVFPGLVLAWSRHPQRGWEAFVVYSRDANTYTADWRVPSELIPVAMDPPHPRF